MSKKAEYLGQVKKIQSLMLKQLPKPLFSTELTEENKRFFEMLASDNRTCLPGQVSPVIALTKGLEKYRFGLLLAEMGSGKSHMSLAIANLLDKRNARKDATHKVAFLTTAKLMAKMAREAYAIHGVDRVKCFEVISNGKFEIDSKNGEPKKFKKSSKKTIGGKRITFKKGEMIPTNMEPQNITPKDQKGKENMFLYRAFPEDVATDKVSDGMIHIYFISKDAAKIGLSLEDGMNWGDRCPHCDHPIFMKNFIKKWGITKSISWKKMDFNIPKGKPSNCGSCGENVQTFKTTNINQKVIIHKDGSTETVQNLDEGTIFSKKFGNKFGPRKIHVGQKLRRASKLIGKRKIFDLLIVDEVHEMQNRYSNQSALYRDLVKVSNAALIMTGTLSNGYPSSIFFILQGVMPKYLKERGYSYNNLMSFVSRYGSLKSTRTQDISKENGRVKLSVSEMPKINEGIVSLLAPFTYWLQIEDMNLPMPGYREEAYTVAMEDDVKERLEEFKASVLPDIKKYNPSRIKSFGQQFVYLQNNPTYPFQYKFTGKMGIEDEETGDVRYVEKTFSYDFEPFPEDRLFSKEERVVNYIREELKNGRRVMLYSIYNTSVGISKRLETILNRELPELNIKRMPDSVGGDKIEPWIFNNPCDVLIVSPLKVSTGLDLVQFPTIAFYETGANLRLVQQASRRSYRAMGQDSDVKVPFFAYDGLQARLLDLIGKKLKGAAMVEGKKVESGQLASVFDDESDLTAIFNEIADDINSEIEIDFSSHEIEPGKLRPNTTFEQEYIDLLGVEDAPVAENHLVEEVVIKKEEETVEEDDIISDEIPEDAEPLVVSPKKEKKARKPKQLVFVF